MIKCLFYTLNTDNIFNDFAKRIPMLLSRFSSIIFIIFLD